MLPEMISSSTMVVPTISVIFTRTTKGCNERYRKADARLEKLQAERQERLARYQAFTQFIEDMLKHPPVPESWEDQPWNLPVKQVVVSSGGIVEFTFIGENKITVWME